MKQFLTLLIISLFFSGCEQNKVTADPGDPMWVILNHVKADKRAQFEKFVYEILLPALEENAKNDSKTRNLIEHTRMLEPRFANKDSSYTYIWLMDPLVKDAIYSYPGILNRVHSPEETKKYISMNNECLVGPQVSFPVKQGRW
jgi:hypothetical protein|tara:strand:+ start:2579 stop:3010 length:432 start_codon:yes stop_codon:yes gene_type:complete